MNERRRRRKRLRKRRTGEDCKGRIDGNRTEEEKNRRTEEYSIR